MQSLYGLDQLRGQLKSVEGLSGWSSDLLSVADQEERCAPSRERW